MNKKIKFKIVFSKGKTVEDIDEIKDEISKAIGNFLADTKRSNENFNIIVIDDK